MICDARGVPRYALGMLEDITERRRAAEQVQREQHLLRQLLDLHEGYRKLIAYEIHDGLAQDLAAAHLNLQSYEQLRESQPDTARTALATGMRLLAGGIAECRRLISGLRPPILDEAGVVGAIEFLVCEAQGAGGRSVAFVNRTHFRRLAAPLENGLFRIVQEALTNAIRHSNSPVVRVTLDDDQARLKLEVRDWGVGFDPAAVPDQHFGLRGIRERARLLGGRAAIASQPGAGTQIDVDLPLVPAAEPTAGA